MIAALYAYDANCTIQAHAGSGIIIARFAEFAPADVTKVLVGKLRPPPSSAAAAWSSSPARSKASRRTSSGAAAPMRPSSLERVKQKFDPHNILNPGRFVYH